MRGCFRLTSAVVVSLLLATPAFAAEPDGARNMAWGKYLASPLTLPDQTASELMLDPAGNLKINCTVGCTGGSGGSSGGADPGNVSYQGEVPMTVGTAYAVQRAFKANCTAAGNVVTAYGDASTGTWLVNIGTNIFAAAVTTIVSATATCTYSEIK